MILNMVGPAFVERFLLFVAHHQAEMAAGNFQAFRYGKTTQEWNAIAVGDYHIECSESQTGDVLSASQLS